MEVPKINLAFRLPVYKSLSNKCLQEKCLEVCIDYNVLTLVRLRANIMSVRSLKYSKHSLSRNKVYLRN